MELRRALALAVAATWGLGTPLAGAQVVPADDYSPYVPSGFFVYDWSGPYVGGNLGLAHTNLQATEGFSQGGISEDGLSQGGISQGGVGADGIGADGIAADGVGADGVGADGFAADGVGADGVGADSIAQPAGVFPSGAFQANSLNYDQSESSFTGGVQAGWQKQWGRLVAGAEVGFSLLGFDTTKASPVIDGLSRSAEVRDIFTLTGRLGYADGRWLAYMKGGLANAEVDIGFDDALTGLSSSSSGRETGWSAGIGIDYALAPNLILGVEYNYLHFNAGVDAPLILDPATRREIPTRFDDAEVDIQNVVVRLNYRFQPGCCLGAGGD